MSKRWTSSSIVAAAVLLAAGAVHAQAVPQLVNFNARLTDGSGVPVSGSHQVQLALYDAATGGTTAWSETTTPMFSATGLVSIEMGSSTPLTSAIFSGPKLYLQISVDGTPLTPRVGLVSVPYALRAEVAASATRLGTLQEADVQRRVSGTCPSGQMMTAVAADGMVTCVAPMTPPAGRVTGGANLIDWTPEVNKWTFLSGTMGTIALNTTDVLEGNSSFDIAVTAGTTGTGYSYGPMIPIDPTRRHRGEVAAKLVTGAGTFYAGYVAYDAAGTELAGNGGTYGYFIANGVTPAATWSRYRAFIQGEGTGLGQFPVGTRFIRPMVLTNYMNIGQTRIDSFSITVDEREPCPGGFADLGGFCFQQSNTPSSLYSAAVSSCYSAGYRLCTGTEMAHACTQRATAGITFVDNEWNWFDDTRYMYWSPGNYYVGHGIFRLSGGNCYSSTGANPGVITASWSYANSGTYVARCCTSK